jgi:hypothetical protein
MAVTRTHFAYRVDMWTPDGAGIVEHLAGVEDSQLALASGCLTGCLCGLSLPDFLG